MSWISISVAASFHEKCVCASTKPGISVAPAASITETPTVDSDRALRPTRAMRLPCTSTSPVYGWAPLPSMIRTLVNSTFSMVISWSEAARIETSQQIPALAGFFDRGPVPAAAQHFNLAAGDQTADALHFLGGRNAVGIAGDKQCRTGDARGVGSNRIGKCVASARITIRRLAHQEFAYQRNGDRSCRARFGRGCRVDERVGDLLHSRLAFAARRFGAGAQRRPDRIRRREQRTEQNQAAYELRLVHGEMKSDDRAERMRDQVCPFRADRRGSAQHCLRKLVD